ncbi:alpha-1A adrenergic receptor [Esox lucius]|uniref:Alpha-1A adrenergic receptor n=1 Tax=Esox lucius TaxID=8010 RepID=A0A3P9ABN2_ESOLU|nr:alpha-1A adrenergic receptor [Esox lucius]XP_034152730.1 alpha-1A adrenergic receptor [Esox lucius]
MTELLTTVTMVPKGENVTSPVSESCPNCSFSSFHQVNLTKAVTLGLVLGVFVVFGVLGNILVILSVVCQRHLRSVTHYFIANLAVADLLLSFAVLPFSATSEILGRWVFGRPFCSAWAALDVLCCTASILSLCVISVDRCLAVSYPLRYPAMATGRRGLVAVAALWGASAAISVGPLFGWKEPEPEDETECRITEEPGYAVFSALGSFYVPLAIILAMYCRVYVVAKRKTRDLREGTTREKRVDSEGEEVTLRIHRGNPPVVQEGQKKEGADGTIKRRCTTFTLMRLLKFSQEKKAAKTLGIVVGCFILCWLPFFLVMPIGSIFPSYRPSDTIFKITFWLGYLNSCINPIIYPCFSQEFKRAFLNVLHGHCLKQGGRSSKLLGFGLSVSPSTGPSCFIRSHPPTLSSSSSTPSTKPRQASSPASPSSSCWRTFSNSSSSVGVPGYPQNTRVQSKSLLKACCFAAVESQAPLGAPCLSPSVPNAATCQAKVHCLSLGEKGEAV